MSSDESDEPKGTDAQGHAHAHAPRSSAPRSSWFNAVAALWMLRNTAAPRRSPLAVLAALGIAWLSLWALIDWWQRQPTPAFYADGIPILGWYALAVVALAALLRALSTPRPAFGPSMVLAMGLVPLPMLLMSFSGQFAAPRGFWWASAAAAIYGLVYLSRGLRTLTGEAQRMAAIAGIGFVAGFSALSFATDAIPDIWNPSEVEAQVSDQLLEQREAALFEQSDRIENALESVHRDPSPAAQGFFLGLPVSATNKCSLERSASRRG